MLRIRALGELAVDEDGRAVDPPASRRAWALLGYLALHPGSHPRAALAATFWPDVLDTSARASMRSALWALRRALGPVADEVLDTARDRVGLRGDVWVDAAAFEAAVAEGRRTDAVALCRGELLSGVEDEWALQARDGHRARLLRVVTELAEEAAAAGDPEAAVGWARRAVALDPFAEDATRLLMERLRDAGDRAAALTAYARLQRRLARELRTAPSAATRALADTLRAEGPDPGPAGDAPVAPAVATPPPAPTPAAATAPAAPVPHTPPTRRGPPLQGREHELAALVGAFHAATSGAGGAAALVTGEPGLGKSRLVTELAGHARAAGTLVAVCSGPDVGDAPPFGLWSELLSSLLAQTGEPPPDLPWVRALAPLTGGPSDGAAPELARARLLEACAEALAWAARRAPLLLVLENLHVADPSSVAVAAHAARRLSGLPALLVLTRRPRPARGDVAALEQALRGRGLLIAELALGPLPAPEVAAVARAMAPLSDAEVDAVVAAADGSPLLATEGARALGRGEASLPAGLRGTVRAATAGLPDATRALLDLLAVAGDGLPEADVVALLPDGATLAEALPPGLDAGMLHPDSAAPRFRHALLRDALYAELPAPVRAALHLRVAARIGAGDEHVRAGEAARHLRLAGRPAEAVAQLRRAAEHARRVSALEEAGALLDQAVALAPHDPELALERADVAAWQCRAEDATAAFGPALEALEAEGDAVAIAGALTRFASWHLVPLCVPRIAGDAYRQAITVLDGAGLRDSPARHEALASLAWTEAIGGDPEAAEAMLAELDAVSGSAQLDLLREKARALALVRRGRFVASYAPGEAAVQAAIRTGQTELVYVCGVNLAGAAVCAGDFTAALGTLDAIGAAVNGHGLFAVEVHLLQARAWVLARLGRLPEAQAALAAARRLADRIGAADLAAAVDCDRGRLALLAGDHAAAEELLASALAGEGGFSRPLARLQRAEALARTGRPDEAEQELRATTREPVRPGDWPDTLVARMAQVQGLVAAARGDRDLADRRLREAAAGWRRRTLAARPDVEVGERWAATLADIGRPVVGTVEPEAELAAVLRDLDALTATAPVRIPTEVP